jgi:hypothetical protein
MSSPLRQATKLSLVAERSKILGAATRPMPSANSYDVHHGGDVVQSFCTVARPRMITQWRVPSTHCFRFTTGSARPRLAGDYFIDEPREEGRGSNCL